MARVAFLMDNMFEDSEFEIPAERVREAGHEPVVVGLEAGKELKGLKGKTVQTDRSVEEVVPDEFDALVIPGGYSPDKIRTSPEVIDLIRAVYQEGKPVAAVCHAPWVLAEAGLAKRSTLTSWPSIRTDLVNAGADWVDQEVVEHGNLITSRKPDDLEAFSKAVLAQIEQQSNN
ncbi:MAG TPA: type 1 glutamine amidotransferase domain-containing protein [Actinomycetota bacterium]|nr:type 1 glutamine amidotransferase domain-containing protein [Actinomycetota bacterium]